MQLCVGGPLFGMAETKAEWVGIHKREATSQSVGTRGGNEVCSSSSDHDNSRDGPAHEESQTTHGWRGRLCFLAGMAQFMAEEPSPWAGRLVWQALKQLPRQENSVDSGLVVGSCCEG
jgi:hypothetical protein